MKNKLLIIIFGIMAAIAGQAGYYVDGIERFYLCDYNQIGRHRFAGLWNGDVIGAYELPISIYVEEYDNGYDSNGKPLRKGATLTVSEIESQALKNQDGMTSLVIPANYDVIGREAFSYCDNLESVTFLNEHSIEIGVSLFQGCPLLKNVKLPAALTAIKSQTFKDCTSLVTLEIPQHVVSINGSAFSGCSSLASLTLPSSLTTIDSYAFQKCTSLTSLDIPTGVTSIYINSFSDCENLKELRFSSDAPTIKGTGTKLSTLYSNECIALVPEGAAGYDVDKNGKWYGLTVKRYSLGSWESVTETTTIESIPGLSSEDKTKLVDAGVSASTIAAWAKNKGHVVYGSEDINLDAFLMNTDNNVTELMIDEDLLAAIIEAKANHSIFKTRFPNAKVSIIEVNEGALKSGPNSRFYRLRLELSSQN